MAAFDERDGCPCGVNSVCDCVQRFKNKAGYRSCPSCQHDGYDSPNSYCSGVQGCKLLEEDKKPRISERLNKILKDNNIVTDNGYTTPTPEWTDIKSVNPEELFQRSVGNADMKSQLTALQARCRELHDCVVDLHSVITPLINRLSEIEDDYIHWPHKQTQLDQFKQKIDNILTQSQILYTKETNGKATENNDKRNDIKRPPY